jgi:hypothetical protein
LYQAVVRFLQKIQGPGIDRRGVILATLLK